MTAAGGTDRIDGSGSAVQCSAGRSLHAGTRHVGFLRGRVGSLGHRHGLWAGCPGCLCSCASQAGAHARVQLSAALIRIWSRQSSVAAALMYVRYVCVSEAMRSIGAQVGYCSDPNGLCMLYVLAITFRFLL